MYFSDSDPLGRTITFGFSPTPACQIVGVVGHVKDWGLQDLATNIRNQVYFPLYQDPDRWVADNYAGLTVVVRTPLDSPTIMPAIKAAVFEAGSDQPVYDIRTMRQIASDSMSAQRFPMILLGVFAGLALLLASVGLYGVISYSVAQRVHEIGIRMALGAKPRDVLSLILWKGARPAALGTVIGIAAALAFTRLMRGWLYGVKATDPITFAAVMLILLAVALLASYIPARRVVRVDPMAALRHE
jgi:putative ABC transport system permease protein